ncbi:MAG: hypothetical protein ACLQQ4_11485 [Bacteroidia bacterium]
MKTKIYAAAVLGLGFLMFGNYAKAQIQDEQNVTITMDLEPVLQLNMNTPDEVDFTFDNIPSYLSGEIKYGATILTVSSTVSWQLYAAGISQGSVAAGDWDNPVNYGIINATSGTNKIPLDALELHQYPADPTTTGLTPAAGCAPGDYSNPFQAITAGPPATVAVPGLNNIFVPAAPYTLPKATDKMIAGGDPNTTGNGMVGGTYLATTNTSVATSGFYYVIDYRIVPGLPVIFPAAGVDDCSAASSLVSPAFADPGYYTMDVKYLLIEAQ